MLNKLQTLQNRAVRIVYTLPRRSNTDSYAKKCHLLPLLKRRKLHLIQLASWMAMTEQYRDLRPGSTRSCDQGKKKLKVIFPRRNKIKRSFLYQGSVIWNDLPSECHCLTDPSKLKQEAIRYLGSVKAANE